MTSPAIMIGTVLAMLYCTAAPVAAQQVDAPKSPGDSVHRDSIRNCVRSCAGGESMPALVYFPRIDAGDVPESQHQSSENPTGAGGLGQVGMHGSVAYTLVVTATGEIDRSSVRVYSRLPKTGNLCSSARSRRPGSSLPPNPGEQCGPGCSWGSTSGPKDSPACVLSWRSGRKPRRSHSSSVTREKAASNRQGWHRAKRDTCWFTCPVVFRQWRRGESNPGPSMTPIPLLRA